MKPEILAQLYSAVVARGLTAPFAEDRRSVLAEIEKVWKLAMPKRVSLDAALQKRLSAIGQMSRWNPVNHTDLMEVASDPTAHRLLKPREITIQFDKEARYTSLSLIGKRKNTFPIQQELLLSIAQLVAVVHAETPSGHAARSAMLPLVEQTLRLLADPTTLLELRHEHLYEYTPKKVPLPSEWLKQFLGDVQPADKQGIVRFDDGLFVAAASDVNKEFLIAFRTEKMFEQGNLNRLLGMCGAGNSAEVGSPALAHVLPIVLINSPGFHKLMQEIELTEIPNGAWPQNPLHTAAKVVQAVQKKLKLSEDAAVLYLQLLALPDPTTAHVRTWNDWNTARCKQAAEELKKHELVLEAKRERAGRDYFLPGEWTELKAPWLPIETWKLRHLMDLNCEVGGRLPLGGPLVQRSFADLFAAAWQRVQDGDIPRYEEVERKRKTKGKAKAK